MSGADLPAALREFVRLFNRGEYWESHEVLEDPWRESRSPFYHGLILFASAFVHVQRNNAHGIQAQLSKSLEALEDLPDSYLGVDIGEVREEARAVRGTVMAREEDPPPRWSDEIGPPRLDLSTDLIRGDEPEMIS